MSALTEPGSIDAPGALAVRRPGLYVVESLPDIDGVTIRDVNEQTGLITAMILPTIIRQEDVEVDREHAQSIRKSIDAIGQNEPVSIGHLGDRQELWTINGFHRIDTQPDDKPIYSTIRPGITYEQLMDLRIISSLTHQSVKFARIVEWVQASWEATPWSDRVTPLQAFLIGTSTRGGTSLDVSTEEFAEIREWARNKSSHWQLSSATVRSYLSTAEMANPKLVSQARDRSGVSSGDEVLLVDHVATIARELPGEKNFVLQELVAEVAKKHGLKSSAIQRIGRRLLGHTYEEALEIVENWDWAKPPSAPAAHRPKRSASATITGPAIEIDGVGFTLRQLEELAESLAGKVLTEEQRALACKVANRLISLFANETDTTVTVPVVVANDSEITAENPAQPKLETHGRAEVLDLDDALQLQPERLIRLGNITALNQYTIDATHKNGRVSKVNTMTIVTDHDATINDNEISPSPYLRRIINRLVANYGSSLSVSEFLPPGFIPPERVKLERTLSGLREEGILIMNKSGDEMVYTLRPTIFKDLRSPLM